MSMPALSSAIPSSRVNTPSPILDVREVADRATLVAMEREWNTLVLATSPEPFYRHEYIRSFVDNFLPGAPLKILTAREANGRLAAVLPLVAERGRVCGINLRQLASPTNVHSFRFDLIAENGDAAAAALWPHLAADRSWDVVKIADVPDGGKAWQLYRCAQAAGFPVGAWEAQRSPRVVLPSSYNKLMLGLRPKFKANLRRRRKRLEEQGMVTVERVAGASLLPRHLEECLALERSGWKGRGGSAVSQSPAVHGFHSDLLRTGTFRHQLSLFVLRLDGRPIAFHYGLVSCGVYSLVMTSYDEAFKELSPGQLLTEEVLKDSIVRGLREFDFLGCDLPWKLEWTATVRRHHWLFIFRDSLLGRALCHVKFGWVTAARERLGRWRKRGGGTS